MSCRLVFGTYEAPDPWLLDRFYAGGGRALDVANVYRDGASSRAAGRWLRDAPSDVGEWSKGDRLARAGVNPPPGTRAAEASADDV